MTKFSSVKYKKRNYESIFKSNKNLNFGHFKWESNKVIKNSPPLNCSVSLPKGSLKTKWQNGTLVDNITNIDGNALIKVNDLHVGFDDGEEEFKQVLRGISINILEGEVLGILGESGSGKSVFATSLDGLIPNGGKITSGKVIVEGIDVTNMNNDQWYKSKLNGKVITHIYQNPSLSLNPVMTIGEQLFETIKTNGKISKKELYKKSIKYLNEVGISNPKNVLSLYPHELSGGMIQRAVIAIALSTNAKIIILDEPTTALDPIIQAKIIKLIKDIKAKYNKTFVFITHDIGVIAAIADRVAVMYGGRILEYGLVKDILWNPQHPYLWSLLLSMPDLNKGKELFFIPGVVPSNLNNKNYEVFAPRNKYALDIDFKEFSPFYKVNKDHFVASRLVSKKSPNIVPPKEILKRWKEFSNEK